MANNTFRGFKYFPESGRLHRNLDGRGNIRAGAVGCKNSKGYLHFGYRNKYYLVHRVAYMIMTNASIPDGMIMDHIDGNPLNNKWSNLRLTSYRGNALNMRQHREGKRPGGYFCKHKRKYRSRIQINGRDKLLGYFETMEEACDRYDRELVTIVEGG